LPPTSGEARRTCLVVTSEEGLAKSLGGQGVEDVLGLLERLVESRRASGVKHLLYVPDRRPAASGAGSLPRIEPPVTVAALAGALRAIEKSLFAGEPIGYVLLVGNQQVIPSYSIENPAVDSDAVYPSDAPYGVADEARDADAYLIADRGVGRLPLAGGKDGGDLATLLGRLLEPPAAGGPGRSSSRSSRRVAGQGRDQSSGRPFGLSAAVWRDQAAKVYGLVCDQPLQTSPPLELESFDATWLGARTVLYFNVHGSKSESYWYGQEGLSYPRVLSPEVVAQGSPAGSLVVCEACYGGLVDGKSPGTSIALQFLARGCLAFIGSSAIAYGSPDERLTEADLLAYYFLKRVIAGERYGDAFRECKTDFAAEMLRRQGYLDGDDKKTLTEFNLFGDPTLSLVGVSRGRGRSEMISEEILAAIKRVVASRFPEMEGVEPDLAEEKTALDGSLAKKVLARRPAAREKGAQPGAEKGATARVERRVFVASFARLVVSEDRNVQRVVRVTFDDRGEVLKVVTSK
jgi:hypothetical protein